jgi:hypothetical protein
MLRIPYCPDNRLTDGGMVIIPWHRPLSTPHKHLSASDTYFCYKPSNPQGLMLPEGLGKLKILIALIGSRTHDLSACSIVPQQITLPLAPIKNKIYTKLSTILARSVIWCWNAGTSI